MGTWGTGILDDDLARDVYDAYVAGTEQGKTPTAIVRALRRTHASELTDPAQDAVFWLALAHAQRDLGGVHRDVHERVDHIVRTQVGLEPWLEIGAVEAGRRKAVLSRFLASLSRPGSSKQPSKRSAKAASKAVDFEVGDCLSIALEDSRFAAAIVTRDKRASTAPSHILTLIDANGPAPPSEAVLDPPRWLVLAPVEFPGLAVKFEVYAEGLARHRARYRLISGSRSTPCQSRWCCASQPGRHSGAWLRAPLCSALADPNPTAHLSRAFHLIERTDYVPIPDESAS